MYCYYCGLPMGKYSTEGHGLTLSSFEVCPFQDFVIKSIWASKCSPRTWVRITHEFGLDKTISNEVFGKWLSETPSESHFNNQLRLFLWIAEIWRKNDTLWS